MFGRPFPVTSETHLVQRPVQIQFPFPLRNSSSVMSYISKLYKCPDNLGFNWENRKRSLVFAEPLACFSLLSLWLQPFVVLFQQPDLSFPVSTFNLMHTPNLARDFWDSMSGFTWTALLSTMQSFVSSSTKESLLELVEELLVILPSSSTSAHGSESPVTCPASDAVASRSTSRRHWNYSQ